MASINITEELVAPSTSKRNKARKVFGDVILNDISHSLCYSPSPLQPPMKKSCDESKLEREEPIVTALFPNQEVRLSAENKENKNLQCEGSSSTQENKGDITTQKLKQPLVHQQRGNINRDLTKKTEESVLKANTSVNQSLNAARKARQKAIRKKAKESSQVANQWKEDKVDARMFYDEVEKGRRERLALRRQLSTKYAQAKVSRDQKERIARREKVDKESQFKSDVFREHCEKLNKIMARKRRESMALRAKIRENNKKGKERLQMMRIEEDKAIFDERASSSAGQREKIKKDSEQRRKSFQFRNGDARRIREVYETLEAKRKEEEHQSYMLKLMAQKDTDAYQKQLDAKKRESLAFRNDEARKQREAENEQKFKELEAEHTSYELKWDGERDAEAYKKYLEKKRRESLSLRNKESRRRQEEQECERIMKVAEEHANFELKWDGEKDAEIAKKWVEKERRESLALRNQEAKRRQDEAEREISIKAEEERASYELKRAAEKDAENHKKQLEEERRASLAQRNAEGKKQREIESQQRWNEVFQRQEDTEMRLAGLKDVDEYKKSLEAERRDSFAIRNREARRKRTERAVDIAAASAAEHRSYELKWAAEKDAEQYRKKLEQERKESFAFRNKEKARHACVMEEIRWNQILQRQEDTEMRLAALRDVDEYKKKLEAERRESFSLRNREARRHRTERAVEVAEASAAEHESYELKWAAEKDAEQYRKKLERERRESFAFRNKEKARHADVMDEIQLLAYEKETESLILKWAGENDGKAYLASLGEERRKSFKLRGEEAVRIRKYEQELQDQEIFRQHEEEEIKQACQNDVDEYRKKNAERDRASLSFRRKEARIRELKEETRLQKERQAEEVNLQLESLARSDVIEHVKECKRRRRLSLVSRAKEKRRNARWKKEQDEREREEIRREVRDRAMASRYAELALQEERTQIAMDAIRHAGCTFSRNPFAGLFDN